MPRASRRAHGGTGHAHESRRRRRRQILYGYFMTGDGSVVHGPGHGEEAGDDSWATRMPVGTVIKAHTRARARTHTHTYTHTHIPLVAVQKPPPLSSSTHTTRPAPRQRAGP